MSAASRVPHHLYPFSGKRLQLDGHHLHYLDEGSGPSVVMVHGNPTWSFYYRELIQALRGDHRVIVPDHIGCGLSDKPGDDAYEYTLERRMQDLGRLIDALDPEGPITLVGHDWGGMIGMGWAAENAERIGRLVLMNTAAFHLPENMRVPTRLAFVRNTRLASWLVLHANLFSRGAAWLAPARRMSRELRDAYCAPYDTPANRIATLRFVQDIPLVPEDRAYEAVSAVERGLARFVDTPTLLLWGQKDFVFRPEVADVFLEHWPHAELHRFPDAGHYVLEDASAEMIPLIRDFLARHPV